MEITIPRDKRKFPIGLVASFLLSILFGINLIHTESEYSFLGVNRWISNGLLFGVCLFYFIFFLLENIRTWFNRQALLTISDEGLSDHLSVFSCGPISWREISSIETRKRVGIRFLLVYVYDPSKIISRQSSFKRIILKRRMKSIGALVIISERQVKYDFDELQRLIQGHIQGIMD